MAEQTLNGHHIKRKGADSDLEKITLGGKLDPLSLFAEYCTFDINLVKPVSDYCLRKGFFAAIEYHPGLDGWIFHSISNSSAVWKRPISDYFESAPSTDKSNDEKAERQLETHFVAYLAAQGVSYARQVRCVAGIADVVTDDTLYEMKNVMSRSELFKAIGQALMYRQCLGGSRKPVIVCNACLEVGLMNLAKEAGIEIILWPQERRRFQAQAACQGIAFKREVEGLLAQLVTLLNAALPALPDEARADIEELLQDIEITEEVNP